MSMLITNEQLYQMMIHGAYYVIEQKNELNRINVFPVADGDTGTNMSVMMQNIIEQSQLGSTHYETMLSISDAALVGARGNSGIIFAQYLCGFTDRIKSFSELTIESLIEILKHAAASAYHAIATPVEGTMITLMRTWAQAIDYLKSLSHSIQDLFLASAEKLKIDLEKTKDMLPVLKENDVVDAGAKGFYQFVLGIVASWTHPNETIVIKPSDTLEIESHELITEKPTVNRYCTEAFIKDLKIDLDQLRALLSNLGDSLVIAGSASKVRIHIHTDFPDRLFEKLDQVSVVISQKVDDMLRQYETIRERKSSIALMTDSIADLPQSFIDHYQIYQYPISLIINDQHYFDKITIKNDRFYQMMDHYDIYPKSSQPNLKQVTDYLSFLTQYYDHIIILTVSSKMSGTYNVFKQAAELFKDSDIVVYDSLQNSGAQGLLVYETAKMIESNLSMEIIKDKLEHLITQAKILVSVPTLKYMVRSGRLSKLGGIIGKMLNLKPVVSIDPDGQGIIFAKTLSSRQSDEKIFEHIQSIQKSEGILSYNIVHAHAQAKVDAYQEKMIEITGMKPVYITDISTVVALNAGIGCAAISYIKGRESK